VYPTRDGEILIGANQDTVFRRLTEVMGRPELAGDPRFADHVSRGKNEVELDNLISGWTRQFDSGELLDKLHEAGIPAGKLFTAKDMLEDPHFAARQALVAHHHPGVGDLMMQNVVPKLSDTPGSVRTPAPGLGQQNDEVYGGLLGLDEGTLARLRETKVI
jgi:formyl-CoA transferase